MYSNHRDWGQFHELTTAPGSNFPGRSQLPHNTPLIGWDGQQAHGLPQPYYLLARPGPTPCLALVCIGEGEINLPSPPWHCVIMDMSPLARPHFPLCPVQALLSLAQPCFPLPWAGHAVPLPHPRSAPSGTFLLPLALVPILHHTHLSWDGPSQVRQLWLWKKKCQGSAQPCLPRLQG